MVWITAYATATPHGVWAASGPSYFQRDSFDDYAWERPGRWRNGQRQAQAQQQSYQNEQYVDNKGTKGYKSKGKGKGKFDNFKGKSKATKGKRCPK